MKEDKPVRQARMLDLPVTFKIRYVSAFVYFYFYSIESRNHSPALAPFALFKGGELFIYFLQPLLSRLAKLTQ